MPKKEIGYPCHKHRIRFKGSYCPKCYKERRDVERLIYRRENK